MFVKSMVQLPFSGKSRFLSPKSSSFSCKQQSPSSDGRIAQKILGWAIFIPFCLSFMGAVKGMFSPQSFSSARMEKSFNVLQINLQRLEGDNTKRPHRFEEATVLNYIGALALEAQNLKHDEEFASVLQSFPSLSTEDLEKTMKLFQQLKGEENWEKSYPLVHIWMNDVLKKYYTENPKQFEIFQKGLNTYMERIQENDRFLRNAGILFAVTAIAGLAMAATQKLPNEP